MLPFHIGLSVPTGAGVLPDILSVNTSAGGHLLIVLNGNSPQFPSMVALTSDLSTRKQPRGSLVLKQTQAWWCTPLISPPLRSQEAGGSL